MTETLQLWEAFKYVKFEPDDEVFEFMRLAKVNQDDIMERWEAIGFFYGCKVKGK